MSENRVFELRAEVYKFVELGIFLYNSKFLLSFVCGISHCQLNDNSRSVNTGFAVTFVGKPIGKNEKSEY